MCFSTILSRVLHKYFVYIPPTPLSNGPSVNKVLLSSRLLLIDKYYGLLLHCIVSVTCFVQVCLGVVNDTVIIGYSAVTTHNLTNVCTNHGAWIQYRLKTRRVLQGILSSIDLSGSLSLSLSLSLAHTHADQQTKRNCQTTHNKYTIHLM